MLIFVIIARFWLNDSKSIIFRKKQAEIFKNQLIIFNMENNVCRFATESEAVLYTIPMNAVSERWLDWQEFDRGPGIFTIPADEYLGIRAQGLHDPDIRKLTAELLPVENLRYLNLTENRGISNEGMAAVGALKQLRYLNIGACDINSQGLAFLPQLVNLEYLNLSYCNRINEKAAPYIQKLPRLRYLDLQGCIKINTGGMKKFEKKGLTIHKP